MQTSTDGRSQAEHPTPGRPGLTARSKRRAEATRSSRWVPYEVVRVLVWYPYQPLPVPYGFSSDDHHSSSNTLV